MFLIRNFTSKVAIKLETPPATAATTAGSETGAITLIPVERVEDDISLHPKVLPLHFIPTYVALQMFTYLYNSIINSFSTIV